MLSTEIDKAVMDLVCSYGADLASPDIVSALDEALRKLYHLREVAVLIHRQNRTCLLDLTNAPGLRNVLGRQVPLSATQGPYLNSDNPQK